MPRLTGRHLWAIWVHVAVLVALGAWSLDAGLVKREEVRVAPEGCDWWSGSPDWPLRTIQAAVNRVRPGGRVTIAPGVYQERIHLRCGGLSADSPTRITAEVPGTVMLSWRANPVALSESSWIREGQYFRRKVSWPVYRVQLDSADCFRAAGGRAQLDHIASLPNAHPAFTYADSQLTVFVPEPWTTTGSVAWNRRVPEPREWGEFRSANIWIEADHIELHGLDLEFGIGSAVRIWRGKNIQISDCVMSGANTGVDATARMGDVSQVDVRRCLYHNYPQHDWLETWLPWRTIYASYSSSTLVRSNANQTKVRECLAVHVGDAVQISSRGTEFANSVVESNWLLRGTDDAIEAEGAAAGITVRHNFVMDFHESLGLSPVRTGPVLIEENICLHPWLDRNGAQIKLIAPSHSEEDPIRNVSVRHNAFWGNWLCWYSPATRCEEVDVRGNLFAVARKNSPMFPPGVQATENQYVTLNGEPQPPDVAFEQLIGFCQEFGVDVPDIPTTNATVGPRHWDWNSHPATRNLPIAFEQSGQQTP